MGLDIYLDEEEKVKKTNAIYAELYGPDEEDDSWTEPTEERKKELREELDATSRWADDAPSYKSRTNPDHLCTRRYLRSSYNSGGFNSLVHDLTGKDLYYIFEPCGANGEEYELKPTADQLAESRKRAEEVKADLEKAPAVNVMFVGMNPFRQPEEYMRVNDERTALAMYSEQVQRHSGDEVGGLFGGSFSNADGEFHLKEPVSVRAIIPGVGFGGQPGCYLVYDANDRTWYLEMCDIIVEFIDEALSMEAPVISWSG